MKGILEHLLTLRLDESDKNEIRFWLAETLSKLNNYKSVLEVIENIKIEFLQKDELVELYILKGIALIGKGDIDEGIELLKSLIPKVQDEYRKSKLLVEIAFANRR